MSTKMQRRIFSLTAVLAFLATAVADAYGLHACPHHDALPAAVQPEPAASHAAHHDFAGTGTHAEETGTGAHDTHGPCTCVGACSFAPAALPDEPARLTLTAPQALVATALHAEQQPRARFIPHFLPYANAPPLR